MSCLGTDGFFKGGVGDEGVDQAAIHGLGGSLKGFQLDGVMLLAALDVADGLLADSHSRSQFAGAHTKGVSNCSDPPLMRARHLAWGGENLEAIIKSVAG